MVMNIFCCYGNITLKFVSLLNIAVLWEKTFG